MNETGSTGERVLKNTTTTFSKMPATIGIKGLTALPSKLDILEERLHAGFLDPFDLFLNLALDIDIARPRLVISCLGCLSLGIELPCVLYNSHY